MKAGLFSSSHVKNFFPRTGETAAPFPQFPIDVVCNSCMRCKFLDKALFLSEAVHSFR